MQAFFVKNNLQICQFPFLVRNYGSSNIESTITLWCGKPFSRDLALWQEEAKFIEENAEEILARCIEITNERYGEMSSSFEKFKNTSQDSQLYNYIFIASVNELAFWCAVVDRITYWQSQKPAKDVFILLSKMVDDYISGKYEVQ